MAIRNTTFIIKNSDIVNKPLPSSLLGGEPIVNTADGIMYFSGVTQSTSEWTPAGTGGTANFFEVGSNLYDLQLRNKITKYQNTSGSGLVGKFLSGTTNGFVLADITDIAASTDSYTTGATWSPNTLSIGLNNGKPTVNVTIDSFNNVNLYGTTNINGDLIVTGVTNLQDVSINNAYIANNLTANTATINTINVIDLNVSGTEIVNNLTITGTGYYNSTATLSNEIVNYSTLTSYTQTNDVYVTGTTYSGSTDFSNTTNFELLYHGTPLNGPYTITGSDIYTTGGTYNSGTTSIDFTRNDGGTYSVNLSTLDINDTKVTGFTYDPSNNTFTIADNDGNTFSAGFESVSGLTVNNNLHVIGHIDVESGITITGLSQYLETVSGTNPKEIVNVDYLTGYVTTTDVYVTGGTSTGSTIDSANATIDLTYSNGVNSGLYTLNYKDTFSTGGTFDNTTSYITVDKNDGTNYIIDMGGATGLPTTDDRTIEVNTDFNWIQLMDVVQAPISGGPRTFIGQIIVSGGSLDVTSSLNITGLSVYTETVSGTNPKEIVNVEYLTGFSSTNDVYVTGATYTGSSNSSSGTTFELLYHGTPLNGPYSLFGSDVYTTGATYNSGTTSIDFTRNDGVIYSADLSSFVSIDTYVTGFTYNSADNSLTISQNQGQPDLIQYINSFSGISVANLTSGQVVYAGVSGELKTDSTGEFAYNDSTNTLTIGITSGNLVVNNGISDGSATFGQGGVVIGAGGTYNTPGIGDLTVHGNFTVFGTATTISTNELYIEDPQITLNYNPTGDTSVTSIASGVRVQDGDGLGNDVFYTIGQMNTFSGTSGDLGSVVEYTGADGYANRAWVTQLNDIVVRNTNLNNGAPDGARVLVSGDVLDGGTY